MVSSVQAAAIKSSWSSIAAGDGGASVGLDMFIRFFVANPSMMSVFGYSGSPESLRTNSKLQNHGRMVMKQLGTAVSEIDDPARMTATLKALGVRHKGFGDIKAAYFPPLGVSLLGAMEAKIGGGLDKGAWAAAYKAVSDAIIAGLQS